MRVIGSVASQGGDTEAPTEPTGLSATAINKNRIDLSWNASTDNVGVAGYTVYRSGLPIDTVDHPATTYTDNTVSPSTAYTYTVDAYDAAGNNSGQSGSAGATTPANSAPAWSSVPDQELIVGNAFNLNLDDYTNDADTDPLSYTIVSGSLPTGVALSGSELSGTPTTAGQSLTITVEADDGNDTAQTVINFDTYDADITAPPIPTGLASTSQGADSIAMTWNASTDVAGSANEQVTGTASYTLYRDGSPIVTQAGTTYTDSGLANNTEFTYTVTARDAAGNESAQSSAVAVSTLNSAAFAEDYALRTSIPGVVWHHDFASDAEVNQFRNTNAWGDDPLANGTTSPLVERDDSDGVTGGGCLRLTYVNGVSSFDSVWWRPFSPIQAPDNGKVSDDPGASGQIPAESWTYTDGGNQLGNWVKGWYAHPDADANGRTIDGDAFYIQMRVKMDPRRTVTTNNRVGKLTYISCAETRQSLTAQEIVTYSGGHQTANGPNYFRMYAINFNPFEDSDLAARDGQQLGKEGSTYPGGPYCSVDGSGNGTAGYCWSWSEGWDTILYRVTPDGGSGSSDPQRVEVWAETAGAGTYTKIWDQEANFFFENGLTEGYQALICSIYQNGASYPSEFWHKYDQIIFSKDYIPCPQDGSMPSWYPAVGQIVSFGSGTIQAAAAADGANNFGGNDPDDLAAPWSGGALVYVKGQPYLVVQGGGHTDGEYNGILKFGPLYGTGSDSPSWSVFLTASDPNDVVQDDAVYADGRAAANHTYNSVIGVGERYYQMQSNALPGNAFSGPEAFVTEGGVQAPIANAPTGFQQIYGATAYWNGNIYLIGGNSSSTKLHIYNIATNSWTSEGLGTIGISNYVSMAVDSSRGGLLVVAGSTAFVGAAYWNLKTGARRTDVSRPSGYENALEYDPNRDVFVSYADGGTLYELDAATLATGGSPSWSPRSFGGTTPVAVTAAGMFGRFRYVHQLKGFIAVPTSTSPAYFFRSA